MNPRVYDLVQRFLGASTTFRPWLVREVFHVNKGDRVLDVGSGTSDILRYLPEVDYIGFEPNPRYVEHARTEFGSRGTFHVGDFNRAAAAALPPVDLALATGLLHHLTDAEAAQLFQLLRTIVRPGGRVVTVDPVYVARQNPLARLLVSLDRGRHVRTSERYSSLASESFASVDGRVIHHRRPPYDHWIMTIA
jgi:SAM-dependent methyltransferase